MNVAEGTTVIGKSVKILGDLSGSEDLTMDGELQGTIQLPGGRLTIGASARCRANIVAQEIIIHGRFEGDIRAKGRVELRSAAIVLGNIYAGSISIEDGAAFRGKIDPSRAGEPLPAKAEEPETAAVKNAPIPLRPASHLPAALAAVAARPATAADDDGEHSGTSGLFTDN